MSSILKALKKAEQDSSRSVRLPGMTETPQRFFIPKKTDGSPYKFWKSKNIWFSFGAVFVLGLSFFLFFKNDTPPIAQRETIQEPLVSKPPEVKALDEIKQKNEIVHSPAPESQAETMPPLKPESIAYPGTTLTPNPAKKTEPALKDTLPPTEREIPLPIKTVADPQHQAAPKDQIPVKESNTPAVSLPLEPTLENIEEETPADISVPEDITELVDENIKIQAISWSKTPEDRIAVVNNKIISEKDYIHEYRVVLIQKDEIILSRSGKRYLLKFRYH